MCDMCVKADQVLELVMSKADQNPVDAFSLLATAITQLAETTGDPWAVREAVAAILVGADYVTRLSLN